jgi:putative tryptophan/tyrosine transport system substrate-binding protein
VPVVGWLALRPLAGRTQETGGEALPATFPAFRKGLAETGYVVGRNVIVEYHLADNDNDQLSALAADLVRRHVAVIVAGTTSSALAAKAATQTIPIVFQTGNAPVALGLVASLNRPAGNLTGVAILAADIAPKRLALLHEVVPSNASIAILVNPANPSYVQAETKDL